MSPVGPLPGGSGPGPRAVADSLDRVTAALGGPRASVLTTVFNSWSALVGEGLAAHGRPQSLRGGVLVVAVDDPAWATQLRWMEAALLTHLAEAVGEGAVKEIRVTVRRQ